MAGPHIHPYEPARGFSPMRRRLLQVGSLAGLPLTLADALRVEAAAPTVRSCILIFYYGGPSHLDTWDMKPDAPAEIRGEFKSIPTSAPGIRISEHLPHCARVMHRLAVIRSMSHGMRNHNAAAAETLTGREPAGGDQELLQDDVHSFPNMGSALSYGLGRGGSVLPHVALPYVMRNVVQLPGQRSGFLGAAYDPFQVEADPSRPDFRVPDLSLPAELTSARLEHRKSLLHLVNEQQRALGALPTTGDPYYGRALNLLTSAEVHRAFDLSGEAERTRDRYGRHRHGQSVLLARRLVESGVRFVSVFDGMVNGQDANWDSHQKVFERHRDYLLPPADQALSALVEDLETRGLLDSTLVLAFGEFGRTPKINRDGGRDHWPDCYSAVLAGGGVRGGTVYGASDETGAYPAADPVTPGDLAATLFWRFGLDPAAELRDLTDRPYRLADGEPIRKLFGA